MRLLETLNGLEEEKGSRNSKAKNFMKIAEKFKVPRNTLYILNVILASPTFLSKTFPAGAINFSRIISNVSKTKNKLQELFAENKTIDSLKDDIQARRKRRNLQIK